MSVDGKTCDSEYLSAENVAIWPTNSIEIEVIEG